MTRRTDTTTITVQVTGTSCGHCKTSVREEVGEIAGTDTSDRGPRDPSQASPALHLTTPNATAPSRSTSS